MEEKSDFLLAEIVERGWGVDLTFRFFVKGVIGVGLIVIGVRYCFEVTVLFFDPFEVSV